MYRIEIDYRKGGSALIPGLKTGVFTLRPLHPREINILPGPAPCPVSLSPDSVYTVK